VAVVIVSHGLRAMLRCTILQHFAFVGHCGSFPFHDSP
jgi:hypothetical protein